MRCAVLGAGSWGTALGALLAAKGWPVTVWDINTEVLDDIRTAGRNTRYLPGIDLPATLAAEADLARAVAGAELVVLVVPSHVTRVVAEQLRPHLAPGALVCCAAKGIEFDTLATMSGVLHEVLPEPTHPRLTFLSGPSFAVEVARGWPTAVTVAGSDEAARRAVQEAFSGPGFRVYTSDDVMGVEVAGCVKNVVAIASGMCEGLGFGANARAALITRGLVEITRLAVAMGAQPVTLSGLSGMGDLMLTCSSELSRNYRVGRGLGKGRPLEEVVAELGQVAEGVGNARSTMALARRHGVDMPISEAVHGVLYEGLSAREAATALMTRALKPEV
ncbi:MAG: NAD(P)-dependent glycerol-3-phosphate dehydrogenase [Kineosporiaceae bacterium]|nr:NAD(P)-dependent glycerol-3-phosphate dehydrogenase [Kineosporiaceae bacterium]